jgi:hypothetical protein
MGFLERLFGRRKADESSRRGVSKELGTPLGLQLLFPGRLRVDVAVLTRTLRGLHASLAQAECEMNPQLSALGTPVGLIQWGTHGVQWVGFDAPMPRVAVERCVAPAHYGAELKARARAHGSHVLLFYAGQERDRLEQYVALGLVASALAAQGALVVLNESGHTSFPAAPLVLEPGEDALELWRTLPLTALYVGFVKQEVEGVPGVWMRTYGGHRMELPDLAWHAQGHDEGREIFERFARLLAHLRASPVRVNAGRTVELDREHLRLRLPRQEEAFLDSPGELLVVERSPQSTPL